MSEKPQILRSFEELPKQLDGQTEDEQLNATTTKKRKERDPEALGRMLLQQMNLIGEDLEIKKDVEMTPLRFFKLAIETGWRNNSSRKKTGEIVFYGPTVMDAYKLYFEVDDKKANADLAEAMKTKEIVHFTGDRGVYMLKVVRLE